MSAALNTLEVRTASEWRAWLAQHHDSVSSYRRHYIMWISMAKQEETRMRRLREAIGLLAAGKKLGLK